jgi:DNA-binding NarL/FixJ family response regulator
VLLVEEFRVAAEASTAAEALKLLALFEPDFLLVDNRLPDHLGTELVRALRLRGIRTPVVMMTANPESGFSEAARAVGAQGSLLKSGSPSELLEAMRMVVGGRSTFDPHHPPRRRAVLSLREREVLGGVAKGYTNREVAEELNIGLETVKTLLGRIFTKLGVRSRAQAVAVARDLGLL